MNIKLQSTDDETTLLMNVWLSVYNTASPNDASYYADLAVECFKKKFLSNEN